MNENHELLYKKAEVALCRVHGDTSVSPESTFKSLKSLREHLDMLIEAVEDDLEREDDPLVIGE